MKKLLNFDETNLLIWLNAAFMLVLLLTGYTAPLTVVFAYFLETIIIGVIHVTKLQMVSTLGKQDGKKVGQASGIGLLLFFVLHYGMFVAIQSIFAFNFFEGSVEGIESGFNLFENYIILLSQGGMPALLMSILFYNLSYFYTNFYKPKRYLTYSASDIFFAPYLRIFVQQFVVIFSGFFFVVLDGGMVAAVLLIVLRLGLDLGIVAIKRDSKLLERISKKLANEKQSASEVAELLERMTE